MLEKPLMKLKNITKEFSGVKVLKDINFEVYPGEVHALIGENGAGKSTLAKIMSGIHSPEKGKIIFDEQEITIDSPQTAQQLGVAFIHQEPLSFPDLSVTENIFVGHFKSKNNTFVDWSMRYKKARELLDSLGVKLNERARVGNLSVADQQMVDIVSALSLDSKLIIMDEPTSSLTPQEVENLFNIIRRLQKQGKAIIFIGHRLEEVKEISQKLTVLRDGEKINTCMIEEVSEDEIIRMMIGREMKELISKEEISTGEIVLEVEDLSRKGYYKNISFDLRKGEIVGVAGLVGAGRTDVAKTLFGINSAEEGAIKIRGKEVEINNSRRAIDNGLAYVPEDRQQQGLFLPMSVEKNITFPILKSISKLGLVKRKKERKIARDYINKLQIVLRNKKQPVKELSGGNQQKVVLSKWLLTEPQILILDEPTRGIDVGVKGEVYNMINELAGEGKSILMISSELPEILTLSDRIIVMCEGQITGRFTRKEATKEKIMTAAIKLFRGVEDLG